MAQRQRIKPGKRDDGAIVVDDRRDLGAGGGMPLQNLDDVSETVKVGNRKPPPLHINLCESIASMQTPPKCGGGLLGR
ncbi:MAG TPA: hypothetical protein VJL90_03060 [Pseudorhodoplanes sp.]|nr:hypothetical protein [Pseudorhodoplanes sp.]